ncbi:hypothetical protein VPHD479_0088 [Vibrio phage D479]
MFIEKLQEIVTAQLRLKEERLIDERPFNPFKKAALSGYITDDIHERFGEDKWVITSNVAKFFVSDEVCYAQTKSMSFYELNVDEATVRQMVADRPDLEIPIENIEK